MSFAERVARQQTAVFRALGEDATWEGLADPVRVRLIERDEEARFDAAEAVVTSRFLLVRRSEVSEPEEGQAVQLLDAAGSAVAGGLFRVIGEPRIDRKGVWTCEVTQG